MTEPLPKFLGDYFKTHAASPLEQPRCDAQYTYRRPSGMIDGCQCVRDAGHEPPHECEHGNDWGYPDPQERINALEADLKALRTENETLRAKAALADEEAKRLESLIAYAMNKDGILGMTREDSIEAMITPREADWLARYDALTPPEKEQQG